LSRAIDQWLKGLGFSKYLGLFAEHEIGLDVLPDLTDADFEKLGIPLGDRKRLLKAIASLSDRPEERVAPEAPLTLSPEAERRQLTVMFCDLVGSTALSGALDPEDYRDVMRAYQEASAAIVGRYDGYVAKYLGDGILAYFGFPQAHEDDAERAVRAGLAMVEAIGELTPRPDLSLQARIGIATGLVVVGDMIGEGVSEKRAVSGESPNLAARLQALAEANAVVISASTRRLLGGLFEYQDLGAHRLKGIAEPAQAWRVVGERKAASRFEAVRAKTLTPFVGREQEVALLLDRWERAKEGEGQVVLLSGEAGIGKSRITQTLRERLVDEPHTRLRYQCSPYYTNSALHPSISQLEHAARFAPDDPPQHKLDKLEALLGQSIEAVQEVAPLFAALLSIPTGDRYPPLDMTPQRQMEQTLETLVDQLVGLAARQPVLFILEDAHWIDPSTLEMIELTVNRVQDSPVLLVITCRPEFTPPWSGHTHVTSLTLTRLGRRESATMVENVTGGKAAPAEILDQIVAKTDGVPLFVEELAKAVLESGLLEEEAERYVLSGSLPPLAIPASLQDSLMARLDRLSPIKEIAQMAAVIGREFSYELLAAVSTASDNELADALAQLAEAELVFRRGVPPRATYTFKHALVRDVAYESLLRSKRQQFHGRIAEVLEEQFPEVAETQPELLANHFTEAALIEQAVGYWHQAGQRAVARSANTEAIAHLTKGLELLDTLPGTAERSQRELTLQITLGVPLQATKGPGSPEAERAYSRARDLCRQAEHAPELFPAIWGLWRSHIARGNLRAGRELAEELLNLAQRQQDAALVLQAHHAQWATLLELGEFGSALEHIEQGIALYNRQEHHTQAFLFGGHDLCVCGQGHAALALWSLGFPDQALDRAGDGLTLAEELSHPVSLAHALRYALMVHLCRREALAMQEPAETLLALASEQNFADYSGLGMFMQGWAQTQRGQNEAGFAVMRQGLASRRATGRKREESNLIAVLAEALGKTGSAEEGLRSLNQALAVGADSGMAFWEAELHRLTGELLLCRSAGSRAEAEASYNQAIAVARRQQAKSLELRAATSLARLWQGQRKHAEARELLEPVYDWFTEGFDTPDLIAAKELLNALK
jgi:predicted ATPase/class 3 adenylate cyclase